MISRDKLFALRAQTKEGNLPDRDQILALCDNGIKMLVEAAGGQSVEEQRTALKERERQLGLAIKDLQEALRLNPERARLIADLMQQMLNAKGPFWQREWAFYQPRIQEEFDDGPPPTPFVPADPATCTCVNLWSNCPTHG